jgi:hypothetical protein
MPPPIFTFSHARHIKELLKHDISRIIDEVITKHEQHMVQKRMKQ